MSVGEDGEWALVLRCRGCAALSLNRVAGDDNAHALLGLAGRPLAASAHYVPNRYRTDLGRIEAWPSLRTLRLTAGA